MQQAATTYTTREVQLVVRETPTVPFEIRPFVGRSLRSSAEIHQMFAGADCLANECFWVLHMDGKNRIHGMQQISQGSLTSSLVHPREVFRAAILMGDTAIVCIHNHPSGDPNPSQEDITITRRLAEVGKLVGIKILDHIIVGGSRYYSFADQGLLGGEIN